MKKILYLTLSLAIISAASCQEPRTVKVTVTEENGIPVPDVDASVLLVDSQQTRRVSGKTDAQGIFKARGAAQLYMCVHLEKSAYYSTFVDRLSQKKDHDVTFVLRKVEKPIPLCARRAALIMPLLGKECGYDFEVGDWVVPHGKGKKSMCIFEMNTDVASSEEYKQSLSISFPNKGDGLVAVSPKKRWEESEFKWFYEAPENKYIAESIFQQVREPNKNLSFTPGQKTYVFRVNTLLDKNGNLISSNYVRVSKGMQLFGVLSEQPGFKITYYYNPTAHDRNLEFDPKKNLFKNLNSTERVNEP
jgi:hypothetical protein